MSQIIFNGRNLFGSAAFLVGLLAASSQAAILHVPSDTSGPRFIGEGDRKVDTLAEAFQEVANGDEIRLYPGKYEVVPGYPAECCTDSRAPLQLIGKTNITVRGIGENVEIYGEGPGEYINLLGNTAVRFENLTFRGNKPPVETFASLYSVILLRGRNENLTFENCRFLDYGNHAISQLFGAKESTGVVVRNCYFENGGAAHNGEPFNTWHADGAAVSGIGSNWLIESNVVKSCIIGFEVEGKQGVSRNSIIRRNTLLNTRYIGITIFATSGKSSDFSDIEISDNILKDTTSNPIDLGGGVAIMVGGGERVNVTGNYIENCYNTAIWVSANWADLRDCVITRNTITNVNLRGIQIYEFAGLTATGFLIQSNLIYKAGSSAIMAAGQELEIVGNTLQDNGWQGHYAGVEVQSASRTARQIRIADNWIGNRLTQFQDYGVWINGDAEDVVIGANFFQDNTIYTIFDTNSIAKVESSVTTLSFSADKLELILNVFALPETLGAIQRSTDLAEWHDVQPFETTRDGRRVVRVPRSSDSVRQYFRLKQDDPPQSSF